jgi:hypothetical protein
MLPKDNQAVPRNSFLVDYAVAKFAPIRRAQLLWVLMESWIASSQDIRAVLPQLLFL